MVRLDALGDSLLSTPALAAFQEAVPQAQMRIFASGVAAPIFEPFGEVVVVDSQQSSAQLGQAIRSGQPEAVVVLTEKRRAFTAAFLSRTPIRIGFDPGLTQPLKAAWLTVALTHRLTYPNDLAQDPGLHEVERYHRLMAQLKKTLPPPGPLLMPAQTQPPSHAYALQMTPKWSLDGWPDSLQLELLKALPEPRLALYGPAEKEWAEALLTDFEVERGYYPHLLDYAGALAGCRYLVTIDTGAAHVAAAVKTPVVDVFRHQHHHHCVRRWRPWSIPHRVVLKDEYSGTCKELADRVREALQDLEREVEQAQDDEV